MFFAVGIFALFVCFAIETMFDPDPLYNPRLTNFLEGVQWVAFISVMISLMNFGFYNMM